MIEIPWLASYLLLGCIVGFFAGLLGIGGGTIMVPILTALFARQGFSSQHIVHLALASSLASIVLTSLSSLRTHHAHSAVLWPVVRRITPGILAGTFGAAFLASQLSPKFLSLFFAGFVLLISLQMLRNVKPKPSRQLPGTLGMSLVGVLIGAVSAMVAIGGGALSVPFLTWCNVRIQQAIGTSAAIGLPIAIAGSLGYWFSGLKVEGLPTYSYGYVYLPAVIFIASASVLTAPLGARFTHRLPVATLKKLFALLLMLLAGKMLNTVFAT